MTWLQVVLPGAFVILLVSNIWLLREIDGLKRQLEAYQREVAALDERVCQLMYAMEEEPGPAVPAP